MLRRGGWVALVLLGALAFGLPRAGAHNPDTSYVRFQVTPTALDTQFTFDVFTLNRLVPSLDANADGQVTAAELDAQTGAIFGYLRQHVQLEIDGAPADFGAAQPVAFPPGFNGAISAKDFHSASALMHFAFHHPLEKPASDFWVQFGIFLETGPRHTVLGTIAHAGQEHEVIFRANEPDYLYDTSYAPDAAPAPPPAAAPESQPEPARGSSPAPPAAEAAPTPASRPAARSNTTTTAWHQIASFFALGLEHIFCGYDHILFLLSLIVVCQLRELVKIVTSFTVAHTITLVLATLNLVELPSRLVECGIAATIIFVALENFWIRDTADRWRLTFLFGLIHGFGFAGVLKEMDLSTAGLVRSLVSFNLGVEAGQLVIVLALFPLSAALARWKYGRQSQLILSALIALCGLGWLLDRVFGLGFMPI